MKTKLLPLVLAINGAVLAMASAGAHAADASASKQEASGIEEVIITARKTEESQQVVPVSVTAFSAEALTKAAVTNINDVHVPGLMIVKDTQGQQPAFSIRGAKSYNGTGDVITAYVGDMPVINTNSIANMLYDLQALTVLKGPQGTLFGANSTGGAMIFIPNKPSDKFEGYADVGIGNYELTSLQGMVNLPINDVAQVRIAGEVVDRSKGYQKNITPQFNGITQVDTDKHESARVSLRLKPSKDWEHNFIFNYFHEDDQPNAESLDFVQTSGTLPFTSFPTSNAATNVPIPIGINWNTGIGSSGQKAQFVLNDPRKVAINQKTLRKTKLWDGQWVVNYDFNDTTSFKSVLAYQDAELAIGIDNDVSTLNIVNGLTNQKIKQWTWEPSVDWKSDDGRLRNKTGLFFYNKDWKWFNSYSVVDAPLDYAASGILAVPLVSYFGGAVTLPGAFAPAIFASTFPVTNNSNYKRRLNGHAIYTQFSYDLSKELSATLGLRYSWDNGTYDSYESQFFGTNSYLKQGFFGGPGSSCSGVNSGYSGFNPADCTSKGAKYKSQAPSFTFTLEDRYNDSSMVYATLRGGYIAGGFNNRISAAIVASTPLKTSYQPEKVVDFETGIKSDWELWNRPIRTNLAVFYANYKNQQRVQNGNVGTVSYIGTLNAGSSTAYGLDLDITYEPTDNLELSASWNHLEAEYTSFKTFVNSTLGSGTVDLSGSTPAQSPKDVVNLAATVKWPLSTSVGKVSSTLSYFWQDKTHTADAPSYVCGSISAAGACVGVNPAFDYRAYDVVPAYDVFNFSTQWKGIMGSSFDANLWVKNLMDKKYYTGYSTNAVGLFGYVSRFYAPPRTFGVNVRYNF